MTAVAADIPSAGYSVLVRYPDGLEVREAFAGPHALAEAVPYLGHVLELPEPVGVWLTRWECADPGQERELG